MSPVHRLPDAREVALPIRLTGILILLSPISVWYVQAALVILVTVALLHPPLLFSWRLWLVLFLLEAIGVIRRWPIPDNHDYLLAYWVLAIGVALALPDPGSALGRAARWLLVVVFLWASLWKGVFSSDYLDGRFYGVQLLTDTRFTDMTTLLAGLDDAQVLESRAYLTAPDSTGIDRAAPTLDVGPDSAAPQANRSPLPVTARFHILVGVLTWGTLLAELAIGILFLLPRRWIPELVRHGSLLAFCLFTYTIVPIGGFGWLLLIMGVSMTRGNQQVTRIAYVLMCLLVTLVTHLPWSHKVTGLRLLGVGS